MPTINSNDVIAATWADQQVGADLVEMMAVRASHALVHLVMKGLSSILDMLSNATASSRGQ